MCDWNRTRRGLRISARIGALLLCLALLNSATRSQAQIILEFPVPTPGTQPGAIVRGPDGNFWFCEYWPDFTQHSRIGRVTSVFALMSEFAIPTLNAKPTGITVGPGNIMWFTESGANRLGSINTAGFIAEFPTPPGTVLSGIAKGPDGRIWCTDQGPEFVPGTPTNGGIIAFTIQNGFVVGYNYYNVGLTVHSRPGSITPGPDGNLWFIERLSSKIGRITTNGVITEFQPFPGCLPVDIVAGPDGAMWFTEFAFNQLGRITTNGVITEYPGPFNPNVGVINRPFGITVGADSNIWYTDQGGSFIGRVALNNGKPSFYQFPTPTTNSFPQHLATGLDGSLWWTEIPGNVTASIGLIGRMDISRPKLTFKISGTHIILSWPVANGTGWSLQANSNPAATTNWVNVGPAPVIVGGNYVVTNTIGPGNLFYRLKP